MNKKTENNGLSKYALISLVAAFITLSLKFVAFIITGSVGLFSDALESIVNLLAAGMTMWMLYISAKPADDDHTYGHTKAEYFASIFEGAFIVLAAIGIFYTAIQRIMNPSVISAPWQGIIISLIASSINAAVAVFLLRQAKKYKSLALEADAHHLFTDVWTSFGVVLGLFIVTLTKATILDPIIAMLIAANIIFTGINLMKRSVDGFMDRSLSKKDIEAIMKIFRKYENDGISFHAFKSRLSGVRAFASVHMLVPGVWTVQKGHDLVCEIENEIYKAIPELSFLIHLEPKEDGKSFADIA